MLYKIVQFITYCSLLALILLLSYSTYQNQITKESNEYFARSINTSSKDYFSGDYNTATILSDVYYMSKNDDIYVDTSNDFDSYSIKPEYKELYEINNDLVGWIEISNTSIDYPVVISSDNEEYLSTNLYGEYDSLGTIFADMNNEIFPFSDHILLYGHHSITGSMFTPIINYEDRDFFYDNPSINFNTIYEHHEWEVFSAYRTYWYYIARYEEDFETPQDYLVFLNRIQNDSYYPTDIVLSEDDTIITLVTCTYEFEKARFIVHARLKK